MDTDPVTHPVTDHDSSSGDDDFKEFCKDNFGFITQNFREYSSISGYTSKTIKHITKLGYDITKDDWIMTEKIHGANFSFVIRGDFYWCCKRSGPISLTENFFSSREIETKYIADAREVYKRVLAQSTDPNDIEYVQIFGEIFGGSYPGFETKGQRAVQKGVDYNPEIDFMVFDIRVVTKTLSTYKDDKGKLQPIAWFVSYSDMIKYLEGLELRYVPVITRGKLEDLLKTSPKFNTTIPTLFGLPSVPGNLAEGYVLKIDSQHQCHKSRPILKIKYEERFGETRTYKVPTFKITEPDEFVTIHSDVILNYCTQNRFNNTVSKIGKDSSAEKILGIFIADACKSYQETLSGENLESFTKKLKLIKDSVRIKFCSSGLMDEWMKE